MQNTRNISPDTIWVGGGDRRLALFENMFPLEDGVTYNSYLLRDEKTALLDTVDASISRQHIENLQYALGGRRLDYLVVHHMEPDHCANIKEIRRLYPEVTIVGNAKTFQLMRQFYGMDAGTGTLTVKEGDTLSLGRRTLRFIFAPMVHWPEVMFSYEASERILFSADAFGTFGGYTGSLMSDEVDFAGRFLGEARRYYTNIVGKYGAQVQAALKKAKALDIGMICPLHGPMLRGADMALMFEKYEAWSAYTPEDSGVLIAYASMYGNTENAAYRLANALAEKGARDIRLFDVSKTHYATIIAEAFRLSHWVLAAPTYNMGLYNGMETLLRDMKALGLRNRDVAIIGNGSWAPAAHTLMQQMVCEMKEMRLIGDPLVIRSALGAEDIPLMNGLAESIAASLLGKH